MHICVRNYCMHNKYMGCTEISLPLVHISGCPTEAKKTIILNAVLITACLVHKVLKFLVCVTHDIMTWLGIFTAANALSLSVQGYTFTNTYLIRVRDCKWRNCIKIVIDLTTATCTLGYSLNITSQCCPWMFIITLLNNAILHLYTLSRIHGRRS